MQSEFQLFPEGASSIAGKVDDLHWFLVVVALFFASLIAGLLLYFSWRYRRGRNPRPTGQIAGSMRLEILWSAIPLALSMVMFLWGAKLYAQIKTPPEEGMQVHVTAKQWMWKIQHPTGQREINALHIPVNRNIVLTMISEDVIHDFYVPAFRVKQDVLPGRYTNLWFRAEKPGRYHLFCAEYCGTKHSEMIGEVIVMEQADYEAWLSGNLAGQDPVEAGKALFEKLRCDTCHAAGPSQRGPSLIGVAGSEVALEGGGSVTADDGYLRESILEPTKKITAGYEKLMPTYKGQISEEEILLLIAYIESLSAPETGSGGGESQ
jgi:cytochrome c oxidase subunit 2